MTLAVVTLVVVVHATEVEVSEDVPWEGVILALGGSIFALALLKNLTDADSAWMSYLGLCFRRASSRPPTSTGRRSACGSVSSAA